MNNFFSPVNLRGDHSDSSSRESVSCRNGRMRTHWYEPRQKPLKALRVRQSLESCTSWKSTEGVAGPASTFTPSLLIFIGEKRDTPSFLSFCMIVFLNGRAELEERERGRERHVERLLQERGEFYSLVLVSINRKIALQNGLWKQLKNNHRTY